MKRKVPGSQLDGSFHLKYLVYKWVIVQAVTWHCQMFWSIFLLLVTSQLSSAISQGFHDQTVAGWGHQPPDVAAGEQAQEHPAVPAPDQLHGRPDGGALQGTAAEEDEEEGAGSGEGGGSLWLKRRW